MEIELRRSVKGEYLTFDQPQIQFTEGSEDDH